MEETNSIALELSVSSQDLQTIRRNAQMHCTNRTTDGLADTESFSFSDGSILHFPLKFHPEEPFKVTAGA